MSTFRECRIVITASYLPRTLVVIVTKPPPPSHSPATKPCSRYHYRFVRAYVYLFFFLFCLRLVKSGVFLLTRSLIKRTCGPLSSCSRRTYTHIPTAQICTTRVYTYYTRAYQPMRALDSIVKLRGVRYSHGPRGRSCARASRRVTLPCTARPDRPPASPSDVFRTSRVLGRALRP